MQMPETNDRLAFPFGDVSWHPQRLLYLSRRARGIGSVRPGPATFLGSVPACLRLRTRCASPTLHQNGRKASPPGGNGIRPGGPAFHLAGDSIPHCLTLTYSQVSAGGSFTRGWDWAVGPLAVSAPPTDSRVDPAARTTQPALASDHGLRRTQPWGEVSTCEEVHCAAPSAAWRD